MTHERVRLGISACLLGEPVRFDGGHKRDPFLVESLGAFVEWVPVCPEVELGLGTPRETVRLEVHGGRVRMIASGSRIDHSDAMRAFARRRVAGLARERLSGYILKQGSPSCGLRGVPIHHESGAALRSGRGLFAEALLARFPHLPVEEEGRLAAPRLRESFLVRVLIYHRVQSFFAGRWTPSALAAFHAVHEPLLSARGAVVCKRLVRVPGQRERTRMELREGYTDAFMRGLARPTAPARRAKALGLLLDALRPHARGDRQHAAFKKLLLADDAPPD